MRIVILQGDFKPDNDNSPCDPADENGQAQVFSSPYPGVNGEIHAYGRVSHLFPESGGPIDEQLLKLGEDILHEPIPQRLLEPLKSLAAAQET